MRIVIENAAGRVSLVVGPHDFVATVKQQYLLAPGFVGPRSYVPLVYAGHLVRMGNIALRCSAEAMVGSLATDSCQLSPPPSLSFCPPLSLVLSCHPAAG